MEMSVNLHLSGETASYIEALVKRGLAANKTEAIRLSIVKTMESDKKAALSDEELWSRSASDSAWNNPQDDKAEKFYEKRYGRGKKA